MAWNSCFCTNSFYVQLLKCILFIYTFQYDLPFSLTAWTCNDLFADTPTQFYMDAWCVRNLDAPWHSSYKAHVHTMITFQVISLPFKQIVWKSCWLHSAVALSIRKLPYTTGHAQRRYKCDILLTFPKCGISDPSRHHEFWRSIQMFN